MSDCLFCGILEKKIPSKILFQDEDVCVFQDVNPQAPVHVLLIPTRHISKVDELSPEHIEVMGKLMIKAKEVAKDNGWSDYRLVLNNGAEAGQTVFHIHMHLLSGRKMTWPPG